MELVEKRLVRELINNRFSYPKAMLNELETFSVKQGVSLERLDEDAKETVNHLVECYEDDCFTKDERVTLAGIALQARLRYQLNKYKGRNMELTRKQAIEELQKMLDYCSIRQDSMPERKQALIYAISSLKTDEAYQIMYEGGEIFTKDEMVDMFEQAKAEMLLRLKGVDMALNYIHEDADNTKAKFQGAYDTLNECIEIVDGKIHALRGEEDVKNN